MWLKKLLNELISFRGWFKSWPLVITRISVGFFFAVSGFYKLFDPDTHQTLFNTLLQAGIPWPEFSAYFVPLIEFIGGIALIIGLCTSLVALVLFILLIVAIVTDAVTKIPEGLKVLHWLDYFLYLPEVLFEYLLFWLIVHGSGPIAFDNLIRKNWLDRTDMPSE